MKALVGTFNQEKALVASRGLLHDCEIFWNLRLKLYNLHFQQLILATLGSFSAGY